MSEENVVFTISVIETTVYTHEGIESSNGIGIARSRAKKQVFPTSRVSLSSVTADEKIETSICVFGTCVNAYKNIVGTSLIA